MHQALIPLESLRAELRRRLEMIRRQRPFPGRSIGTFGGLARAPAIHIKENTMNTTITRRIQLVDVTTSRQNGEQDAQALLKAMTNPTTEGGQQDDASAILIHSLHPIIELAQHYRVEECTARLEGFAKIIGPVLERSAIQEMTALCAVLLEMGNDASKYRMHLEQQAEKAKQREPNSQENKR